MSKNLVEEVEERLQQGNSLEEVKQHLREHGYKEEEIESAIEKVAISISEKDSSIKDLILNHKLFIIIGLTAIIAASGSILFLDIEQNNPTNPNNATNFEETVVKKCGTLQGYDKYQRGKALCFNEEIKGCNPVELTQRIKNMTTTFRIKGKENGKCRLNVLYENRNVTCLFENNTMRSHDMFENPYWWREGTYIVRKWNITKCNGTVRN